MNYIEKEEKPTVSETAAAENSDNVSESLWEHLEETYKTSERRYRLLAENVTDVIWTMDRDLHFTYVSPSVVHMRGYSAEEAVFQSLEETFTAPSCLVIKKVLEEELLLGYDGMNETRHSRALELDQRCKNGSIICTETKITFIRNSFYGTTEILGVTRDVTERKRMEEQLKQSELLASLGKMTAGIAHEVNNPLGSILLYSELMMKSELPEETKKDLKVIHNEARRAAKVMSDLLAYSLGTSNNIESVNIHQVLHKVLDMRLYAETVKNIIVKAAMSSQPLYIYGDKSQLAQVFMNILLNAEEALEETDGGVITVTTDITDGWAVITVSDNGTGIPENNLNQIFYPFYTTKQVGAGTGLGLSTCYGIVTSHGGLIRAENNSNGGATIIVELPLSED